MVRSVFIIAVTALAYYVGGQLGLMFAIPPSNAGILWPPAGFSLVAALYFGIPALVGIFIGAIFTVYNLLPEEVAPFLSAVNGLGSALQAWFGCLLIKHFVDRKERFVKGEAIFRLLMLAGPLACVISPSINLLTQLTIGQLSFDGFLSSWIFWWVGDSIGVLIFAPLVLLFFGESSQEWSDKRRIIGVPILISFALTMAVFWNSINQEKLRLEEEFQHLAERVHSALILELESHVLTLSSLGGFFETNVIVDHSQFGQFAKRYFSSHRDQVAFEWLPFVKREGRTVFENEGKKIFGDGFEIRERRPESEQFFTANERDWYLPIFYSETKVVGARNSIGIDLAAETELNDAIMQAVDSGKMSVSEPVKSTFWGGYIFSMFLPLLQSDVLSAVEMGVEQRKRGLLNSVIDFDELIEEAFEGIDRQELSFSIFNKNGPAAVPFFSWASKSENMPFDFKWNGEVVLGSSVWSLELTPSDRFVTNHYSQSIWMLLVAGVLFTAIVSLFVLMVAARSSWVERVVTLRTVALAKEIDERRKAEQKALLNEERFVRAIRGANEGVWDWNIETGEVNTFPVWEELLGYEEGELEGSDYDVWSKLVHPDDLEKAISEKDEFLAGNREKLVREFRMKHKSGSWVWILSVGEATRVDANGRPMQVAGTRIEITQRKMAEEAMRIAAIAFDTHEGILITDEAGTIVRVNPAFTKITGYTEEEALGENPRILKSGKQGEDFYKGFWEALERDGRWSGEIWNKRKTGEVFPIHTKVTNVVDGQGRVTHRVAIFSDITQHKEDEEAIRKLAFYDSLTGLPNRRLMLTTLDREVKLAKRSGKWGALIFLDLDHFKTINDSLGHEIGDKLLQQVGLRLKQVVREADLPSRLGGDEFVVLLSADALNEEAAAEHALLVSEKIQTVINEPFNLDSIEYHVTTSIGVKLFPLSDETPATLIRNADTAMYKAKEEGRNTIRFYNKKMQENADDWLQLKNDLHRAIENCEFELYFQSQHNPAGEIIGAEVLLRWNHPEKGFISPMKFIPVAEQTGQIVKIGEHVLEKACQYLRQWKEEGLNLPHLAVNVSPHQFKQENFIELVRKTLKKTGAPASQLMIELTEGVVVDNVSETIMKMHALKGLGVCFSIDDFGTGYSSLSYLKKLPLDQLKIDRTFVRDIATDANDAVIVETIIGMARHLQFNVIAEGVEDDLQLKFLEEQGCNQYQGYYFSQPEPASQFERRLRGGKPGKEQNSFKLV